MSEAAFAWLSWCANWKRRPKREFRTMNENEWNEKRFNEAMATAEAAVMRAEHLGFSIEGATARAENLVLECVDMDRAAPKKGSSR